MDFTAVFIIQASISALLLIILIVVIIGFRRQHKKSAQPDEDALLVTRLNDIQNTLDTRLHQNAQVVQSQMNKQLESSNKIITDITRELTEVKAAGKQMLSFADQLQSLERVLKNPQRRGAIGEYVLAQVIGNVLPSNAFATQYTFRNGTRVDAVVFLQDKKIISIDAKFSLDNYTKLMSGEAENPENIEHTLRDDLKKRIQETAKYILPQENTLDYAFMFLPSEALYYDLLTQKISTGDAAYNMIEYAFTTHKVIIVSPTTLLAYLQTVSLGLRSFKIEKHAQDIMNQVISLKKHLDRYQESFHSVGKSLSTTVNHYNKAEQQYGLIDKDVLKISGEGGDYTKSLIDGPHAHTSDK